MIFKTVFIKEGQELAKIAELVKNDGDGTWATCTKAVYKWAKKTFSDGDKVDIEYSEKDGKYHVTKITKAGSGSGSKETKSSSVSAPTCSDCDKELKDDKYTKCYTCNKKNPVKSKRSLSDSTGDSICRQNANHATSRALIALQGHIDVNNIFDIAKRLHKMFYDLTQGE